MISPQWDESDFDNDQASPDRPAATLVSLHFIRSALQRRWLVCVMAAALGLLAATGFLVVFPASHQAKTALILAHGPDEQPSQAMATDVSLLKTQAVAAEAVARLGVMMTPEAFLSTVTAEAVSSELLSITLSAPTDAEAVRRLQALTAIYLDFRGKQRSMQSDIYVQGMQERISKFEVEIGDLSKKIEGLSAADSSASKLSDMIAQRAFIQGRIDSLHQQIEDVTLQSRAVVASSRVIDPATIQRLAVKRRIALTLASGLIGGAALSCGLVLLFAITSNRLRRRSDVSVALDVPVPISVGRISPVPRRLLWLPNMKALDSRRTDERQRLARAIEMELPEPRRGGPLAVICLDNAHEVGLAMAVAAINLAGEGCSVVVIDLTNQGSLDLGLMATMMGSAQGPTVIRPKGIPVLAGGMDDLYVVGNEDGNAPSLDLADISLVLADFDASVGADYLLPWTDRVMIAVTAGRSSAEIVRTAADMIRTAGLQLRIAALLHTERTDDSSGTAGFDRPIPIHVVDEQDRTYPRSEPRNVMEATAAEHVAADDLGLFATDELAAAQSQTTEEQRGTEEETGTDRPWQPINEEPVAAESEEQPVDEDLVTAETRQPVDEDLVSAESEGQLVEEDLLTAEPEQQLVHEESFPAESAQHPVDEELPSVQSAARPAEELIHPELREEPVGDELVTAQSEEQPVDEDSLTAEPEQQLVHEESFPAEPERHPVDEELPSAESTAEPDEELIHPELREEPVGDELVTAQPEEQPVDADDQEPLGAQLEDEEAVAVQEQINDQEWSVDNELTAEAPPLHQSISYGNWMREKQTPDEESTIDLEPTIEMAAAADGDPATSVEEPAIVEPTSVQESTFDDETEATVSQQTSDAQPSVDDQPTVTVEAVDSDEASTEELILSQELADLTDRADRSIEPGADHDDEFDWNWDWPKDVDSQHDLNIAATDSDEQAERPTEPHQMPYVSPSDTTDEWALYPDAHPTSAKGSESGSPAEPIVEADIHDGSARPAASGRLPNGQGRNQPRRKTRRRSGSRK